ncbi:hypothetical protein [Pseudobacteriovorax antillogorgiicola]|uniref:PET hydrolase/cutinase-like domain-containing protein n=1 Tax=Pseudobacteriovorax antillogorgiicola TaxID=1513793 RepID=A0A1Y6BLH8_9BACT|nr:hypothetical protein [Pseudobacteriovorax antillogorgiicola]TCS56319.1 hypothetical protein EDD56_104141 [Pseudobacteriovorax antillogorgiicola]SMF07108.1 hypothetical protein SAMN06296036_104192 [Pseudobacteriovorax antillogorgiicola]
MNTNLIVISILLLAMACNQPTEQNEQQTTAPGQTVDTLPAQQPDSSPSPEPTENPESFQDGTPFHETDTWGPYRESWNSYDTGLESEAYESAKIFYPIGAEGDIFPATTLSPGLGTRKEMVEWLAKRMASHGFIVITFTPTNINLIDATIWQRGHEGALDMLKQETANENSAIFSKVNLDALGIVGHSMGGAGTILAANARSGEVKAAIPLMAFAPALVTTDAAVLLIAGVEDIVSQSGAIRNRYNEIQGKSKAFMDLTGVNHNINITGPQQGPIAAFAIAWHYLFLKKDLRYMSYFTNSAPGHFSKKDEALSLDVFSADNFDSNIILPPQSK